MSQTEVLNLLKKKRVSLSSKEITKHLGLSRAAINKSLNVLARTKEIKKINLKENNHWINKYSL